MLSVICAKMTKLVLSVLVVSTVFVQSIKGSSMDDLKQTYTNLIMECATEYPITTEDAELLKTKQIPDNENVKCLFACVYKKTGMMNNEGKLSIESVREISKTYLTDNPDEAKKSEEFTQACISVNNEPVSDGTKGCERAALIYKCSVEKLPEFGFSL